MWYKNCRTHFIPGNVSEMQAKASCVRSLAFGGDCGPDGARVLSHAAPEEFVFGNVHAKAIGKTSLL